MLAYADVCTQTLPTDNLPVNSLNQCKLVGARETPEITVPIQLLDVQPLNLRIHLHACPLLLGPHWKKEIKNTALPIPISISNVLNANSSDTMPLIDESHAHKGEMDKIDAPSPTTMTGVETALTLSSR